MASSDIPKQLPPSAMPSTTSEKKALASQSVMSHHSVSLSTSVKAEAYCSHVSDLVPRFCTPHHFFSSGSSAALTCGFTDQRIELILSKDPLLMIPVGFPLKPQALAMLNVYSYRPR